jgi:hypothetical protein
MRARLELRCPPTVAAAAATAAAKAGAPPRAQAPTTTAATAAVNGPNGPHSLTATAAIGPPHVLPPAAAPAGLDSHKPSSLCLLVYWFCSSPVPTRSTPVWSHDPTHNSHVFEKVT